MKADVELGGTDQKFNMLVGRELQRLYGQEQQVVMTMPILEGTDGVQKMSKSLNNYIGIAEDPRDMFGKIMSVSDDLMWRYYELLSLEKSMDEINAMRHRAKGGDVNPRDYKIALAEELIGRFHDQAAFKAALDDFQRRFQQGAMPDDMPEIQLRSDKPSMAISIVLKDAGLTTTTSESRRMIKQGAVKIDGEKVADVNLEIAAGPTSVFQVGKRKFARVTIKTS
jgi:tyrosyl-tRNA synthetase